MSTAGFSVAGHDDNAKTKATENYFTHLITSLRERFFP